MTLSVTGFLLTLTLVVFGFEMAEMLFVCFERVSPPYPPWDPPITFHELWLVGDDGESGSGSGSGSGSESGEGRGW